MENRSEHPFEIACDTINLKIIHSKLYETHNDFTFPVVKYPFNTSSIPAVPTYGVYISQLIRYSKEYTQYRDFLGKVEMLT